MSIPMLLVGFAVLTLGRKLYWLFVGAVGFVLGTAVATRLLGGQPDWVILIIALAVGLLGALLTLFIQRLAVGWAGFLGGGYIATDLLNVRGWTAGQFTWLPFLIGGIVGLVLVLALFDWALIILSSFTGACLIVQATYFQPSITAVLFTGLVVVGIVIQAGMMRGESS